MKTTRIPKADPVIEAWAISPERKDKEKAAKSRKCLPETLAKLARDETSWVRYVAMDNPKFPAEEMERLLLAEPTDNNTHWTLLGNPSVPTDLLMKWVKKNGKNDYRYDSVLSHPNCPRELIDKHLSATSTGTASRNYHGAIARNRSLLEKDIAFLFRLREREIDIFLIRNGTVSQDTLALIFNRYKNDLKIDPRVLRALILRLKSPELKQKAVELLSKGSKHHTNREFVASYTLDVEHAKAACLDENKAVRQSYRCFKGWY
jgi:hypothetical protein